MDWLVDYSKTNTVHFFNIGHGSHVRPVSHTQYVRVTADSNKYDNYYVATSNFTRSKRMHVMLFKQ